MAQQPDSFTSAVTSAWTFMGGAVRRSLTSPEDREDAMQEASIKAWKAWETHVDTNTPAWLCVIARHAALSLVRRQMAHKEVTIDPGLAGMTMARTPSAERAALENLLRDDIGKAIGALPTIYRETILDRIDGMSYEQIADTHGTSVKRVNKRLQRSRELLREQLGDAWL